MFLLEVDPSLVKPGWTPLIITILLAAAIVLLMISMRRQIRKISAPHRDEVDEAGPDSPGSVGPGEATDGPSEPDGTPESDGGSGSDGRSESDGTALGGAAGDRHPIGHG